MFREKLGYLEGGSETLLQAIKRDIEAHGGEIRLKAPVTKVLMEGGKVQGVEVNGEVEHFDKVISTIPLQYVPKVMPDLPDDILHRFKALKNVAVVLSSEFRRHWIRCPA